MSLKRYFNSTLSSDDYILEVIKGNAENHGIIRKFFQNPLTLADTDEEVWGYAPTEPNYTYTADSGADFYVFSSEATDTQIIYIHLLDTNFDIDHVAVQLAGQTPVRVGAKKYTRVYRMFNLTPVSFIGNIFCTEGDDVTGGAPNNSTDVRAYIFDGNNITLMCQYTTPNNIYGMLLGYTASITKKQAASADVSAWGRLYGTSFHIRELIGLNSTGSSYVNYAFPTPVFFPPKTDITIKANVSTAGASIVGSYSIVLVHESLVNASSARIIS